MLSQNYEIRCEDINGALSLHAEMFGEDDWRVTSPEYAGIIKANRESVITFMADSIGRGRVYRIIAPTNFLNIDRCFNAWVEGKYFDPAIYLAKIVPDKYIDLSHD